MDFIGCVFSFIFCYLFRLFIFLLRLFCGKGTLQLSDRLEKQVWTPPCRYLDPPQISFKFNEIPSSGSFIDILFEGCLPPVVSCCIFIPMFLIYLFPCSFLIVFWWQQSFTPEVCKRVAVPTVLNVGVPKCQRRCTGTLRTETKLQLVKKLWLNKWI